jgi:hypothetical protein
MNASYFKLQDELLKVLIGEKDSSILSRRLGFSFNQVARWKNHSKKLKWNEFIDICRAVKFPIENVLEDVFGISIRTKSDCNKAFVKILLSQIVQKSDVGKALDKSRPTIYRLKKMKTYPDFVLILALIDLKPKRLVKFIETIKSRKLDNEKLSLASPFTIPWFGVVSSAMAQKKHLSLPAYSAEWIANKVKLTVAQVEKAVEIMQANELISLDGRHFKPTMPRTMALNHKRSRADFLNTFKFWSQKSITALEDHRINETSSQQFAGVFRTFMATRGNVEQINELIAELEEKIHNIITTTTEEKTEIRCFVFSHFDVEHTDVIR